MHKMLKPSIPRTALASNAGPGSASRSAATLNEVFLAEPGTNLLRLSPSNALIACPDPLAVPSMVG